MDSAWYYYLIHQNGCKSRLLFAKIAMAIWCQVSGFRNDEQRRWHLTPDTSFTNGCDLHPTRTYL